MGRKLERVRERTFDLEEPGRLVLCAGSDAAVPLRRDPRDGGDEGRADCRS
jgi:hypothetical protein